MENQNANEKLITATSPAEESRTSGETNQIPKPASLSRAVSFSSIEIREYPLCMGDNPGCLRGIPITIGWTHTSETNMSLDDYEETRGESSGLEQIPPYQRFNMLSKNNLYTRCEIMKALQKVESDRESRRISSSDSEKFEEIVEGLKRGFLNKTFRRKTKQKERELLLPYQRNSPKKGILRRSHSIASTTSCESNLYYEDDQVCDIELGVEHQATIKP